MDLETRLWPQYFAEQIDCFAYQTGRAQCGAVLSTQESDIERLLKAHNPSHVLCLGAGFLNDFPIEVLFRADRQITFVDWLSTAPQQGMRGRTLSLHNGHPACLFCTQALGSQYCANFSGERLPKAEVCSAYRPSIAPEQGCANYLPSQVPHFLRWDVTAGFANEFATACERAMRRARNPKDALSQALHVVDRLPSRPKPLPLPDGSVDLLTSSMVISQFDIEPLGFVFSLLSNQFERNLLERLVGTLQPLLDELRKRLFLAQAQAHILEMHRLLKADGIAYLSVELFHQHPQRGDYFLVPQMGQILDLLNRHFSFDLSALGEAAVLRRQQIGDGYSMVQSYVLRPS